MIRPLRSLLLALVLGMSTATAMAAPVADDQLEQVVLLSRHNLRAPVVGAGALANATPERWPGWDVGAGELTTKGGVLEVYMGRYIGQWLRQAQLLPVSGCPQEDDFHAYANSLQRTQATAQFFVAGAFPGCHVSVEQRMPLGTMDPLFDPVIRRDDAAFRTRALESMQRALAAVDLAPALSAVEEITRYPQSAACKGHGNCNLALADTTFSTEPGKEPRASGITGAGQRAGRCLVDGALPGQWHPPRRLGPVDHRGAMAGAGADPQPLPGHPVRNARGGA